MSSRSDSSFGAQVYNNKAGAQQMLKFVHLITLVHFSSQLPTCCFSPTSIFFDTHPPFRDVPLMQYEVLISFPCDLSKTLVLVVAFTSEAHKKLARRLLYHNTITQHFRLASSPQQRRSSSILAYVH